MGDGARGGPLVTSQVLRSGQALDEAIRGSVAGVGAMVLEGLVLLTTVAYALGSIRLTQRRVLVQEPAAIGAVLLGPEVERRPVRSPGNVGLGRAGDTGTRASPTGGRPHYRPHRAGSAGAPDSPTRMPTWPPRSCRRRSPARPWWCSTSHCSSMLQGRSASCSTQSGAVEVLSGDSPVTVGSASPATCAVGRIVLLDSSIAVARSCWSRAGG